MKIILKGGTGSGNYGHAGRPGKVGGSAGGRGFGGGADRADERAKNELKKLLPNAKIERVEGDYTHEPRVLAIIPDTVKGATPTAVGKALREQGWKKWPRQSDSESVTYYSPNDKWTQISVDTFHSGGGGGEESGLRLWYYPKYKFGEYND